MKNKISIRSLFLFFSLVLISNYVFPGTLDPTFGAGGKFTTSFPDSTTFYRSFGTKIFVQPSGRIVAGGTFTNNGPDGQASGVALVGLNSNGTFDTSFGTGGGVFKDWGPVAITGFQDAFMQPDGKLIRLSQFFSLGGFPRGNVIRSTVDGLNDSSFAADVNIGNSNTIPITGALLLSGKVIVTTFTQTNPESFHIYRLNADGSRDTTFGVNGGKQLTWMSRLPNPWFNTMALLPNGDMVLIGDLGNFSQNGYPEFFIARLNPDGNLDPMFGRQGLVRYRWGVGSTGFISDLIVRADGSCVLAGGIFNSDFDTFMIGFTRRGKFDATFGVRGVVVTDVIPGGRDLFSAITENAGKLIVVGEAPVAAGSPSRFLVSRFSGGGVLEAHTKTEFTPGQFAYATEVTVQPDGKILVIGSTNDPATAPSVSSMWAIARYTDITNDPPRPGPSNK
jgi:uncharacterized delta-60 repeat protein